MRNPRRRGFSLIEILLALVLLTVALIPALDVFISSGDSLKQTRPYHHALLLAEKVLEDLRGGSYESPYFLERFRREGIVPEPKPVVGGGHPYFRAIEDTAEPFGRIEPGKDAGIEESLGLIEKELQPLEVGVTEQPGTGDGHLVTAIKVHWKDTRRQDRTYEIQTPIRRWTPLEGLELSTQGGDGEATNPRDALEGLMSEGMEVEDILATEEAELQRLIQEREATTDPLQRAKLTARIAKRAERVSILMLGAIQQLASSLRALNRPIPLGALRGMSETQRGAAMAMGRYAFDGFFQYLFRSLKEYVALATMDPLPPGGRLWAHQSVMRVGTMSSAALGTPSLDTLKQFAETLRLFYDNRQPEVAYQVVHESRVLDNPEKDFPLYPSVHDLHQSMQGLTVAQTNLAMYTVAERAAARRAAAAARAGQNGGATASAGLGGILGGGGGGGVDGGLAPAAPPGEEVIVEEEPVFVEGPPPEEVIVEDPGIQ